jgi:hypothetical protein
VTSSRRAYGTETDNVIAKWCENFLWLYRELVCFVANVMGRRWTVTADSKK